MSSEDLSSYFTLKTKTIADCKVKGSKFYGIAFECSSKAFFDEILLQIKLDLPQATHYCYAYKIGTDGNNFRINDDGEPSGTAGKQIFGVIESNNLSNVGIVVVRYYGGTKLGVPGLISAYKSSAVLSVEINEIILKHIESTFEIHFPEDAYASMQISLGQLKGICSSIEMSDSYRFYVKLPVNLEYELYKIIFESINHYTYEESYKSELENIIKETS